ncbi:hypothetical protein IMSHALPRED_000776 [Imshaugia aleurites]|uniref:Uncharacterized protein n=1 Tax=Imshaugia aleurites TaxID=172621 RepID=A0A8H3G7N2_9LECA|nr:hypothetical protein IMSHALPRED_000776 [Imshaugia aleurites]
MFEPLSALAVLGFAMGALGFMVSTISEVDEKVQVIREWEKRLQSFNWQLEDVYMKLKVWQLIWVGKKAFPHETYVHFWGVKGLEHIQSRVNGITELSNEIKNLIYQPVNSETEQSLPRSELRDWHRILDHDIAGLPSSRHAPHRKASLVRKIGFALFRNTILTEKISRLDSHVVGLRDFTQYTFRLEQKTDPDKKVTSEELRRISELKLFFDRMSMFGSLLYDGRLLSSRLEWAIELGPPEAGHTLDLWSEVDTMYIDFIVRDTALQVQTKASRVRFCVEEQMADTADTNGYLPLIIRRINELVLSQGRRENHSEYDRFFRLLEEPSRRSRPLRKMLTENIFSGSHRKSFEVERADLVYGLENRFRLLGVALTEIALAQPISVILEQEDTSYLIGEKIVGRKRLLGMLRERFGQKTITKAVSYCLDPDASSLGDPLRPDHLEQYCQNITFPLTTKLSIDISRARAEDGYVVTKTNPASLAECSGELEFGDSWNDNSDSSSCNEDEDEDISDDKEDTESYIDDRGA